VRIIVSVGDQQRAVTGRTAQIVALLVTHAERIDAIGSGRIEINLGGQSHQCKVSIYEHLAAVTESPGAN
jgi:hypothetical protein